MREKLKRLFKHKKTCTYDSHKTAPGKVWHFLWHEDTWLSFFVDAVLIVLIGYILVFPIFGVIMGTNYPAVAVISGSMDHGGKDFDTFFEPNENKYAEFNITYDQFNDFEFRDGFSKGDILVVRGQDEYEVGDVIVYAVDSRGYPIIHRTVAKDKKKNMYQTYGDANSGQWTFEKSVTVDQIEGKAVLKIPYLGWVKVLWVDFFSWLGNKVG